MPLNVSLVVYKLYGSNQGIDIRATVTDAFGASVAGATVSVSASNGSQSWSGVLSDNGAGTYSVCNVGSFSGWWFSVAANATASKPGYISGTAGATGTYGNLNGCP
jgi:hypothetical protein